MSDYIFCYEDEDGRPRQVPVTFIPGPSLPTASQPVSKRLRIRNPDTLAVPTESASEDHPASVPALL